RIEAREDLLTREPRRRGAIRTQYRDVVSRIPRHHPALASVDLNRRKGRHAAPTRLNHANAAGAKLDQHRAAVVEVDTLTQKCDLTLHRLDFSEIPDGEIGDMYTQIQSGAAACLRRSGEPFRVGSPGMRATVRKSRSNEVRPAYRSGFQGSFYCAFD